MGTLVVTIIVLAVLASVGAGYLAASIWLDRQGKLVDAAFKPDYEERGR